MRNIFEFLRRSSTFLLFLVLQIISISLLVKYNRTYEAGYMGVAYEVTGAINKRYNTVTRYWGLNETNRRLLEENTRLRNLLGENYLVTDSGPRLLMDTTFRDSTRFIRKFYWHPAQVINNSISAQNNLITLSSGSRQGVKRDMAVVAPGGIVGVVTDVSANNAVVMSLLNRKSSVSAMLRRDSISGMVSWDGVDPGFLQLKGIPKYVSVQPGDTIFTSNISLNYPPGLIVGTVAQAIKSKDEASYIIKVKPGANFYNLQQVSLVENRLLVEQQKLEEQARQHNKEEE